MALFEQDDRSSDEIISSGDVATRALSVTDIENDFVAKVYENLASVYDLIFGPALHPGRLDAIHRMNIQSGDRILEVGVGTGINTTLYPSHCAVTGVDLSDSMLEKARDRVAQHGVKNVRLLQMDAAAMTFADGSFDTVYAPYLINVVPDPLQVAKEMRRVCKIGGRIIFLNHFRSTNPILSYFDRLISPLTVHVGFKSDLDLPAFLAQADLKALSIEKVNCPKIWSLVICENS